MTSKLDLSRLPACTFSCFNFRNCLLLIIMLGASFCFAQEEEPEQLKITTFNEETKFTCITVDTNNNVWAGTDKKGLFLLDKKEDPKVKSFSKTSIIDDNFDVDDFTINALAADSFGNLWVAHKGKGFQTAVQGGMERVDFNNPSNSKHFGPDRDIRCLSYLPREGLGSRNIQAVTVDKNGTVWTANGWDNIIVTGEVGVILTPTGPVTVGGGSTVYSVGALAYKPANTERFTAIGTWSNRDNHPELPYPAFTCDPDITETPQGRTFNAIATNDKTVWVSSYRYQPMDEDLEPFPTRILEYDLTGNYKGDITYETIGIDASFGVFTGMYFSKCNNSDINWVTLSGRLGFAVRFKGNWIYMPNDKLPNIMPADARINNRAIWGNGYGQVFIGTNKGLLVYDGMGHVKDEDSYKFYTTENGLTSNNILGGYSDRDSLQWMATDKGIMKLPVAPTIRVHIELAENSTNRPDEAEFWGEGDVVRTRKIYWDKQEENKGVVVLNYTHCDANEAIDITDLHLLKEGQLYAKSSFHFAEKNVRQNRKKEVIVFVHNDLVKFNAHPEEGDNNDWKFKQKYGNGKSTNDGDFYQATMLIPPAKLVNKRYGFDNIEKDKKPFLFIHGYTGTDNYWGNDENIYDKKKEPNADLDEKEDYFHSSYPARLRAKDKNLDIWEFYYAGDQASQETAFLLGRALKFLHKKYDTKISIAAHSMGGLLTRAYIEGVAENYTDGGEHTTIPYEGELDKVIFLSTPHHGSFGGTRLYFGIFLETNIQGLSGKDPNAPAARELSMAGREVMELNDKPFDSKGVTYYQVTGTTHVGLTTIGPFKTGIIGESYANEDGIVSLSAGNLLDHGIPCYFLKGFSHVHMNTPDAKLPDGFTKKLYKNIIPQAIYELYNSGEIQSIPETIIQRVSKDADIPESIFNEEVLLDICMPIVTFKEEDGSIWYPRKPTSTSETKKKFRFKMDVKSDDTGNYISLTPDNMFFSTAYKNGGQFLYFSGNYFPDDKRPNSKKYKQRAAERLYAFYAYRRGLLGGFGTINRGFLLSNPLDLNEEDGKVRIKGFGVGWHLPDLQELKLPVEYSFHVPRFWQSVKYIRSQDSIELKRATTTYNHISMPRKAEPIANAKQSITQKIVDLFTSKNNLTQGIATSRNGAELMNWVDCHTVSTSFVLEHGDNVVPKFELVDPNGNTISANMAEENDAIYFHRSEELNLQYFSIINPEQGAWKVKVNGSNSLPDDSYRLSYPMDVENPAVLMTTDSLVVNEGITYDSVVLQFFLTDPNIPLKDLTVEAVAFKQGTNVEIPITFNDDGINGDSLANDGVFSSTFFAKDTAEYRIIANVFGLMDGCPFIRESYMDIRTEGLPNEELQSFNLSGTIAKETQETVSNVIVTIADKTILTRNDGRYSEVLLGRQNYTIKPTKTERANNGLSISDILQIQSHIIGRRLLDSPYKMIAADVNNSGSISTSDLLAILDIVLGNQEAFDEVPSWKFVPTDFEFSDPADPFDTTFPDSINIADLSGVTPNLDFIAIKMGDVNLTSSNDLTNNPSESRTRNDFNIQIQDQKMIANTEIIIPIRGTDLQVINGYQLGLNYDEQSLELLEVMPIIREGFDYKIENDVVKMIWLNPSEQLLDNSEPLLQLRFKTKSAVQLSDVLQLAKTYASEAVMTDLEEKNIQLTWKNRMAKPLTVNVFPNPVKHQMQVEWTSSETTLTTQIEIFNNLGQNVLSSRVKNTSQTTLNLSQLASGSYIIRLEYNGQMGYTKFIKED